MTLNNYDVLKEDSHFLITHIYQTLESENQIIVAESFSNGAHRLQGRICSELHNYYVCYSIHYIHLFFSEILYNYTAIITLNILKS